MAKQKKHTHTQTHQIEKPTLPDSFYYIVLAAFMLLFVFLSFENRFLQDDSYITFRYVMHFLEGNGLVFNIGERVEGYTNFLWLMILSFFGIFKANYVTISQYLSVGSGLVTLWFTYLIARLVLKPSEPVVKGKPAVGVKNRGLFAIIPVALVTFTGAYTYWAVSGMESMLFIAFVLAGIYFYLAEQDKPVQVKFPVLFFLAALTRPEGVFIFGLALLHNWIFTIVSSEDKAAAVKSLFTKNKLITYAIFVIPFLIFIGFRMSYYGYPFPNTYYAKTGFSAVYFQTGLDYLWAFVKAYMLFGIVLAIGLYVLKDKKHYFPVSLLAFISVIYMLYVVSVGGDVLPLHRFFLPVVPLLYILFSKGLQLLLMKLFPHTSGDNSRALTAAALVIGLCFYNYTNQKDAITRSVELENGLVEKMSITGKWLNQKQKEKGSPLTVAATTIGAVSYFAGPNVNIIDMLGLTDAEVAHNPKIIPEISEGYVGWKERNYNVEYILSRKPDYVYFSTGIKPSAYAERALFTNNDFIKYYFPYYFNIPQEQFTEIIYKRKSDTEAANLKQPAENPNYKKSFINSYTGAMNVSRDKARTNEALSMYRTVIENGPLHFGTPYQFIGEIFMGQGNRKLAMENFKKAVEIDEYNILSHYYLYQMYLEDGDTASATRHIDNIRKLDPELLSR